MRQLAAIGVEAGEVSGGTVGAALAICGDDYARDALGIREDSTLFLLLTEGLTDPDNWRRVVGA
jgi:diaminopropionate ammonia-lyase